MHYNVICTLNKETKKKFQKNPISWISVTFTQRMSLWDVFRTFSGRFSKIERSCNNKLLVFNIIVFNSHWQYLIHACSELKSNILPQKGVLLKLLKIDVLQTSHERQPTDVTASLGEVFRTSVGLFSRNVRIYKNQNFIISCNTFGKVRPKIIKQNVFLIFLDSTKLKIIWIKITTFFKRCVSIILWSFSS